MKTQFVLATFNIRCQWAEKPPVFRVYVNDEMFTEREWAWDNSIHLNQMLQIQAPPGEYKIEVCPVGKTTAEFITDGYTIEHGTGRWIDNRLVIEHESTWIY